MNLPLVQNYHKHTDDTNPIIKDSAMTYDMLAKKTIENKGKILCSVAHQWQGRYHICYEVAKKYGLKFIFGTEAYFVKDRFEKDATNAHIILLAKNKNGMRAINEVLSIANENGYFYKARIDFDLIFNILPKEDVFITSACVGGWKYEDSDDIWLRFYNHFKDNFMLEVQLHNTEYQKEINRRILNLHKEYGIKYILGLDSHYLNKEDKETRDLLLGSSGIQYHESECGWEMHYPSNEEIYEYLQTQDVLTHEQIITAMDNTNVVLDFEDIDFNTNIKLPSIYPNLTQEEKNKKFKEIVNKEFEEFIKRDNIPKERRKEYIQAIREESAIILNTNMTEYFLLNYEIIKKGKEKGGIITPSSRGSGGSFLLNTLFRFSDMDRLTSPIKLFPERFLTEDRIKSGSLVDIDFNVNNDEPFVLAQKEILGETHAYPMIAFGTVKIKSGFKLYSRSKNLPFSISNEISKQISIYEKVLAHTDDEDKDKVSIYDYVDKEYHNYIKESEHYLGLVVDKKIAPCSHLLYTDEDIRKEIGVIRLENKTTKEIVMCACIEGSVADRYGYLKNDILTVTVLDIIHRTFTLINQPIPTPKKLSEIVFNNDKVWDIYKNGHTICINQCESISTTKKVMRYQPKNITELAGFIASIRPSFQSMYGIFESREPFSYGIKAFDELIQTPEMQNSFLLYQEQLMQVFNFAGFPITECYAIIKAVAKKKPEKLKVLKKQFMDGFSNKLLEVEPNLTSDAIKEYCDKIWGILNDSASYSFNASHSLAYTYDSLYCAYLKSHYPFEFYSVILTLYSEKGEKDRVRAITREMEDAFGIKLGVYKFGEDNSKFSIDKEKNLIHPSLNSLKAIGKNTPNQLTQIPKDIDNFIDLLVYITENLTIKKNELEMLIKIDYFSMYGTRKQLLQTFSLFKDIYKKNNTQKTKDKKIEKMKELYREIPTNEFSLLDIIKMEIECLGNSNHTVPSLGQDVYIVSSKTILNTKYLFDLFNIKDGKSVQVSVNLSTYNNNSFKELDLLSNLLTNTDKYGTITLKDYVVIRED